MNTSFLFSFFLFIALVLLNKLLPKDYRQPFQRLLLVIILFFIIAISLFPDYLGTPIIESLHIKTISDLVLYLTTIFIFSILYKLYKEVRELNAKINKLMQISTLNYFFKSKDKS